MNCTNCKREIDNDSKFCEFCGNETKTESYAEVVDKILKEETPKKKIKESELEQLNSKIWYRVLKVLYFLGIALGTLMSLGVAIAEEDPIAFFSLFLATLIISEVIKRSFYYIILGKIFPKK